MQGLNGLSLTAVMERGVQATYVVFCNTAQTRWYNKYLKKNFQHCWVLHYDGYNWYKLEHNYSGCDMEMIVSLESFVFNQCQDISRYYNNLKDHTVVEIDRVTLKNLCGDNTRSPFIAVASTCVEYVKDFCAIRKWWCFTPYQLYNHIIKLKETNYGRIKS